MSAYQYWPEESGEYAVAIRYKDSEPFFAVFIDGEEPLVVEVCLTVDCTACCRRRGAGGSSNQPGIYRRMATEPGAELLFLLLIMVKYGRSGCRREAIPFSWGNMPLK